jgi:hypothetical protein
VVDVRDRHMIEHLEGEIEELGSCPICAKQAGAEEAA